VAADEVEAAVAAYREALDAAAAPSPEPEELVEAAG
jgi:collagenase-like PrtC family protease